MKNEKNCSPFLASAGTQEVVCKGAVLFLLPCTQGRGLG